ncbi:MAG: DNA gyrase subunit A [Dehalococcoidia bacterium]|nr:DNA gyrase subunit A [Dehalococcoidia bacterium]
MVEAHDDRLRDVQIVDEMRGSYLDYAMSVIVSRALPDVRDGLKPVHRRILYAMDELGVRHDRPHKKSARIVGEVMGKYHPHGENLYDSMVRLAQDFSLRYPLVDGQGNFGSVDNDPPAAMRYTEARLSEIAEEMLADIEKDTVEFTANFDGSLREPVVLPTKIPNLLINGSSGIAVGMATNIPPHNLGEICGGLIKLIENPETTGEELNEIILGPDFPTAGIIIGREGVKSAFATGRGRIVVRAKAHIEEMTRAGRLQIVVTELPYQINKASLVERIADLVKDKKIEGISEIRDESDRHGLRVIMELRREANPKQVLNALFKHTALQSAFFVNMLALVDGQPRIVNLKTALQQFIDFRRIVVRRRSQFDLGKAKARGHILDGLKIALDHLDEVIKTIRASRDSETARTNLIKGFKLSQEQAQAILEMQLRRLAALERKKILDELAEVRKTIAFLEDLIAHPAKIDGVIREEVQEISKKYGDARRTQIVQQEAEDFTLEDLIPHQQVVITMSQRGYIKRIPASTYRPQRRGGRGISATVSKEEDAIYKVIVADTHDSLLLFSNGGKVFHTKVHELPEASRQARGLPVINIIGLDPKEHITEVVKVESFEDGDFLIMATAQGEIKKTPIKDFSSVRSNGLIAMDLAEGDELVCARLAKAKDDIIIVTYGGKAIRFSEGSLRSASRQSGGVKGVKLGTVDRLVGMDIIQPGADLIIISSQGFGKRTPLEEFPVQGRGGGGVIAMKVDSKSGNAVAAKVVRPEQELMVISADGVVIRTLVSAISQMGRNAKGVSVMRIDKGNQVVAISTATGDEPLDTN